jgi:hypothetical protein
VREDPEEAVAAGAAFQGTTTEVSGSLGQQGLQPVGGDFWGTWGCHVALSAHDILLVFLDILHVNLHAVLAIFPQAGKAQFVVVVEAICIRQFVRAGQARVDSSDTICCISAALLGRGTVVYNALAIPMIVELPPVLGLDHLGRHRLIGTRAWPDVLPGSHCNLSA